MPEIRRPFFVVAIVSFVAVVAAVGSVNWVVDPYRILHDWSIRGVTESKPVAGRRGQFIKAILAERADAETVVLGASRADVGIDPHDAAWPARSRPIFNFGVPGSRPYTQFRNLQHAAQFHPPSLIVMCADYLSFLEVTPEGVPLDSPGGEGGLRVSFDGAPTANYRRQRLYDLYSAVFSIDALAHSIETLMGQTGYVSIDARGFSSGAERFLPEIAAKGQYSVVRDVVRVQAAHLATLVAPEAKPSTFRRQLAVLERIFELAREHKSMVKLFVPPSHAYELENLRTHGLWGDFERWKLEMTLAVERANQAQPFAVPVTLTDFSGYHSIATEVVPAPGDKTSVMRWYWEPIHYREELGERIVEDLFSHGAPALGVDLTSDSICPHLLDLRSGRDRYASRADPQRTELFGGANAGEPAVPAWAGTVDERCGRAGSAGSPP